MNRTLKVIREASSVRARGLMAFQPGWVSYKMLRGIVSRPLCPEGRLYGSLGGVGGNPHHGQLIHELCLPAERRMEDEGTETDNCEALHPLSLVGMTQARSTHIVAPVQAPRQAVLHRFTGAVQSKGEGDDIGEGVRDLGDDIRELIVCLPHTQH
jgi:hypothetical protein